MNKSGPTKPKPTPTQAKIDEYIGRTGHFFLGGMQILIKVEQAKKSYSHIRLLCQPLGGGIAAWKNLEKLTLDGAVNHNQKDK